MKIALKTFSIKRISLLIILLFLLLITINYVSFEKDLNRGYNLEKKIYNPFLASRYNLSNYSNLNSKNTNLDILGTWYLKDITNANIVFEPETNLFNSSKFRIKSLNIDLLSLNSFVKGSFASEISNWDYESIKNFYSLELIGGKLGILHLRIDDTSIFLTRVVSKNAVEGIYSGGCICCDSFDEPVIE